jgi:hypothetical protein
MIPPTILPASTHPARLAAGAFGCEWPEDTAYSQSAGMYGSFIFLLVLFLFGYSLLQIHSRRGKGIFRLTPKTTIGKTANSYFSLL